MVQEADLAQNPSDNKVSCNMKSQNRWIEIRFAYLCYALYDNLKDYVLTTNYIEFLADIANMDKSIALRLLQKVNQINSIRPTKQEFICVAKQNKMTIARIMELLQLSKGKYIELIHMIDLDVEHPAHCTQNELNNMVQLLEAHNKLKEAGL